MTVTTTSPLNHLDSIIASRLGAGSWDTRGSRQHFHLCHRHSPVMVLAVGSLVTTVSVDCSLANHARLGRWADMLERIHGP
jgi:hypothetical protein